VTPAPTTVRLINSISIAANSTAAATQVVPFGHLRVRLRERRQLQGNGARGGIEGVCYIIGLIDKSSVWMMIDTRKITQSKIVPAVRFRFPTGNYFISPTLASSFIGLHPLLAVISTPQDFRPSG
jgi:hypothetical protein